MCNIMNPTGSVLMKVSVVYGTGMGDFFFPENYESRSTVLFFCPNSARNITVQIPMRKIKFLKIEKTIWQEYPTNV